MIDRDGFSDHAELYASSPTHAETGDLELALSVLGDVDGKDLLDVATGAGHAAFFFAEQLAHVFAVDKTASMLSVAQEQADARSLSVRFIQGAAEDLPFDDGVFDIVITRLAVHHFQAPVEFLKESHRVLRDGGQLLVIDNFVPEGEAGGWINELESKRDPSHQRCLTRPEWSGLLQAHGFRVVDVLEYPKTLDFALWMRRMSIEGPAADEFWESLLSAPSDVREFLLPTEGQAGRALTLHRLIAVAKRV
jgi:SAM-dependent methyltransferase